MPVWLTQGHIHTPSWSTQLLIAGYVNQRPPSGPLHDEIMSASLHDSLSVVSPLSISTECSSPWGLFREPPSTLWGLFSHMLSRKPVCCINLSKGEATNWEQPAGCAAWPLPKGCFCKCQVWFCGRALHPDPSSSTRLKEAVFLAVPVFTSCAVVWGCDSPLGRAEPGRSCMTQQKGWWVTQESREELLTLPSLAPSPSTRLHCEECRTAYLARHPRVCISPLRSPSKATAVPPEKSQGERKCSSITWCDLFRYAEFWGAKPVGFCSSS